MTDKKIITLNIEGQVLKTYSSLLKNFTYFESVIDRWNDNQESIFVDCDYNLFKHMLNSMRIPGYIIPKNDRPNVNNLKTYFGSKNNDHDVNCDTMITQKWYFDDLRSVHKKLHSIYNMTIYVPLGKKLEFTVGKDERTIATIDNILNIAEKKIELKMAMKYLMFWINFCVCLKMDGIYHHTLNLV